MAALASARATSSLRAAHYSSLRSFPSAPPCRVFLSRSSNLDQLTPRRRLPSSLARHAARPRALHRFARAASADLPAEPAFPDLRIHDRTSARIPPAADTAATPAIAPAIPATAAWVLTRLSACLAAGLAAVSVRVPGALALGVDSLWNDAEERILFAEESIQTPYSPDADAFVPFVIAFVVLFLLSNYVAPYFIFKDTVFRKDAGEDGDSDTSGTSSSNSSSSSSGSSGSSSNDDSRQQGKELSRSSSSQGEGKGFGKK